MENLLFLGVPILKHIRVYQMCTRCLCAFNSLILANLWPQSEQRYGLSPLCKWLCLLRDESSLKALLQSSHLKGFSPVWVRSCRTVLA